MRNKSLMRLAVCLIGMAAMVLQGCSESGTDRDKLCGSWSSVEGKPDVPDAGGGDADGGRARVQPETAAGGATRICAGGVPGDEVRISIL